MKQGISYSFLLNIVILFIFVCFSIVMGIMSYYRAYKAGAIIVDSIEKYEGYNCLSKNEISQKLGSIAYNVPFDVSCRDSNTCEANNDNGYVVISSDLDFENADTENKINGGMMNSSFECREDIIDGKKSCRTNKHYQYTVYTYMYFDLPVISQIARIPFISRTRVLYEFRDWLQGNGAIPSYDSFSSFHNYVYSNVDDEIYVTDENIYSKSTDVTEEFTKKFLGIEYQLQGGIYSKEPVIDYLSSMTYPNSKRDYVIFYNKLNTKENFVQVLNSTFYSAYECGYKMKY